jgi:hypothetical protein
MVAGRINGFHNNGKARRREGTLTPMSSRPYVHMWTLAMSGRKMLSRKRNDEPPDGSLCDDEINKIMNQMNEVFDF